MKKSAPLPSALTAIFSGAVLMFVGVVFLTFEATAADSAYGVVFMGFLSILVGTICLHPERKEK